jgi:predicted aldo/keto reductase-like oxidoreductase
MIDQILKDHKPGEKPRFFLHDEMKAWLGDNLDIQVIHGVNKSADFTLSGKLGLYETLTAGHNLQITVRLAGEIISMHGVNLSLVDHEQAFKCLANVTENCMIQITQLQQENLELKRRIDLIENPLPL